MNWHPVEAQTLLSGSFDHTVRVYDCRAPTEGKFWTLGGEVERIAWNHKNPYHFLASTDSGDTNQSLPVSAFQARGPALPIGHALIVVTISLCVCMCVVTFGAVREGGSN